MNKLTALLLASALVFPAAANAKQNDSKRTQVTHVVQKDVRGNQNTKVKVVKRTTVVTPRFAKGQRFDRSRATSYRVVDYRSNSAKLRRPPAGYTWVRSGRDVYLIRSSNGLIASVVTGIFR